LIHRSGSMRVKRTITNALSLLEQGGDRFLELEQIALVDPEAALECWTASGDGATPNAY